MSLMTDVLAIEVEARRLERVRLAAMLPDKWRTVLIEDRAGFVGPWIAMPREDYDRLRDLARELRVGPYMETT